MVWLGRLRTVMVFVEDPSAATRWWAETLDATVHPEMPLIDLGDVELYFHRADPDRNPKGGSTVPYFAVDDLDAARDHLLAAGCEPWRGPLRVGERRRIAQVRDPFGLIVGLDGP